MHLVAGYAMLLSLIAFTAILSPITTTSSQNAMLTYMLIAVGAFFCTFLISEELNATKAKEAQAKNASDATPLVENQEA